MPHKGRASASSSNAPPPDPGPAGGGGGSDRSSRRHLVDEDDETWRIRGVAQNIFDTKLEYGTSRYRFSLAVHHGGTFVEDKYVGGELDYVDNCTKLAFGLVDLSSIMLRLGYPRGYICEFYYAHPFQSHACVGFEIGHPLSPLIDEDHMKCFKQLAPKGCKLVHIYVLEITVAEARARLARDQAKSMKVFYTPKSAGVVIEEIEEPPRVVPKQRPRKKAKVNPVNPTVPLLDWRERDSEFEEYLKDSLVESREQWKRAETQLEEVCRRLSDDFNEKENADQGCQSKGKEPLVPDYEDDEATGVGASSQPKLVEVGEEV